MTGLLAAAISSIALSEPFDSHSSFFSADDQIKDIVDGLRGIIPLKSENIDLIITVPAQYAAQSYSVLKSSGTLKKEEWLSNGSLKAILEIAAARRPVMLDKLGSVTKGTATAEMVQ